MKQVAKVQVTDIKEENGVYVIGVKVRAEGYEFLKAYQIKPLHGSVDVKTFKENIRSDIIKEVAHRKAVEPIKALQAKEFNIEYGNDTKNDNQG